MRTSIIQICKYRPECNAIFKYEEKTYYTEYIDRTYTILFLIIHQKIYYQGSKLHYDILLRGHSFSVLA